MNPNFTLRQFYHSRNYLLVGACLARDRVTIDKRIISRHITNSMYIRAGEGGEGKIA